ncbi:50S ribosomal protein L2 [Bienertia sinuspersici]
MKESILNLASALRRGSSSEGIDAYVMARKKICKTLLSKCLVYLKKAEKCRAMEKSGCNSLRMLKEAESISLSTLKCMLFYLMGEKDVSQAHGWSLVAKLVKSKHVDMEIENASELDNLDRVLLALWHKSYSSDTNVLLKQLEAIEMTVTELQDGMDSLSSVL